MSQLKLKRSLSMVGLLGALLFPLLVGCEGGNTDGGPAKDDAGTGDQFVSDGGAGGSIRIVVDDTIEVGETKTFFVDLRDSSGAGIGFVRIFCESEKGIAIIEPSSGGVAFENTGPDGSMSGSIGGLTPGSFAFECRAPEGFNLVARIRIKVTGEVPDGFEGFPGAAGGNLGGGVLVDDTPDADDDDGVQITGVTIQDIVEGDAIQIDITRNSNCDGDSSTTDPEPYVFNNVTLEFVNNTPTDVILQSVRFSTSAAESGTQGISVPVTGNGGTGSVTIPFTDVDGSLNKLLAGGSDILTAGTFTVTFRVTGVTEDGESFTITGRTSRTFGNVNNCPDSSSSSSTTTTTTTT